MRWAGLLVLLALVAAAAAAADLRAGRSRVDRTGAEVDTGGLAAHSMKGRTEMETQDGAHVTESVHIRRADGSGEEQDRTWDTPENGGTTVVLQNMNSLEAHIDRSKQLQLEKQQEQKSKDHKKKIAEEQKWKKEGEDQRKADKKKDLERDAKNEEVEKKAAAAQAQKDKKKIEEAANKANQIQLTKDYKPFGDVYGSKLSTERFGTVCVVSGLVRGETRPGLIAVLPETCRPSGRIMFMLLNPDASARIDVKTNGEVHWVAGVAGRNWISLSGMSFTVSDNIALPLLNNWEAFGGEWRQPGLRHQGDLCVVSGLVKNANFKASIARVDKTCAPNGRLIFSVSNHERVARLDVTSSGEVVHSGGAQSWGWMSLDGILYSNGKGTALDLGQGWKNYERGYRGATLHKIDNLCIVSGLITFADSEFGFMKHMATLPESCRPEVRLAFPCNVHEKSGRCEVLPDGKIMYFDPEPVHKWVSISAINFLVKK